MERANAAAIYASHAAEVDQGLARLAIPHHLQDGLRRYALDGDPVGSFLTACIDNDLREAVSRGDDASLAGLKPIVQFLYNYAPAPCHGSRAKREAWQACRGVRGYREGI